MLTREQRRQEELTVLRFGVAAFGVIAVLLAVCLSLAGKTIDNLQETNALLRAEIQAAAATKAEGVKLIPEVAVVAQASTVEAQEDVEPPPEEEPEWSVIENAICTAYCPCSHCCGKWADGITATGATAQEGVTVAVDPKVIPLGSLVRIGDDPTVYVAQDTGGGVNGAHVDKYYDSHQAALNWGVVHTTIYWRNP